MEPGFLGVPGVTDLVFLGLVLAALATSFLGLVTGTAGGMLLLGIMAVFFTPAILIPMHTVVQMGASVSRTALMWRFVMKGTLPPFLIGAIIGATVGGQIFVTLSAVGLQALLGTMIIVFTWMPRITGGESHPLRFGLIGCGATFLGMFVSATGTLISPLVAHSSPDRLSYSSTFGTMMAIVHGTKLVAFGLLGMAITDYIPLMAAMIGATALGNYIGTHVLKRVPETAFRYVLKAGLTLLALRLLWKAAMDAGWI